MVRLNAFSHLRYVILHPPILKEHFQALPGSYQRTVFGLGGAVVGDGCTGDITNYALAL